MIARSGHGRKAGYPATIGGGSDCILRNVSKTAFEVTSPVDLPEKFTLVIPGHNLNLACRVIWRLGLSIGVKFDLNAPTASLLLARQPIPDRHPYASACLDDQRIAGLQFGLHGLGASISRGDTATKRAA